MAIATWERAIATGEPYDVEYRIRRADGVYRWFHVRGTPLRDVRGHIIRWYVLETDINDRKRAEALLASEKRLLEMVAGRQSLSEILEVLCQLAESAMDGCYCSILLVDPSGTKFQEAIAPSLAAEFNEAAHGWPLQDRGGPCVTAARDKIQVIMSDVAYRHALAQRMARARKTPRSEVVLVDADRILGRKGLGHLCALL